MNRVRVRLRRGSGAAGRDFNAVCGKETRGDVEETLKPTQHTRAEAGVVKPKKKKSVCSTGNREAKTNTATR